MRLFRSVLVCILATVFGLGILVGPESVRGATPPLGIDVSSAQGVIDWSIVSQSGIAFAWCEATEGTFTIDPMFASNVVQAQSFGLPIGMYHIAHPELDAGTAGADLEAAYFWSQASNYMTVDGLTMMPVLDYEISPGGTNTAASSSQWVNEWCQDIYNYGLSNGLSLTPVVFTESGFITIWFDTSATNWPLWYANHNGRNPLTSTSRQHQSTWPTWQFWQYGLVFNPGIPNGTCDGDVFNGTAAYLAEFYRWHRSSRDHRAASRCEH